MRVGQEIQAAGLHEKRRVADPRDRRLRAIRFQEGYVGFDRGKPPAASRRRRFAAVEAFPLPCPEAALGGMGIVVAKDVSAARRLCAGRQGNAQDGDETGEKNAHGGRLEASCCSVGG